MTFDEAVATPPRMARMGNSGSLKAIKHDLSQDEDVVAISTGVRKDKKEPGVLAITDKHVIWASKTLGSGGIMELRYDRISTVESGKSLLGGHTLTLCTSGADIALGSLKGDYGNEIRDRVQ